MLNMLLSIPISLITNLSLFYCYLAASDTDVDYWIYLLNTCVPMWKCFAALCFVIEVQFMKLMFYNQFICSLCTWRINYTSYTYVSVTDNLLIQITAQKYRNYSWDMLRGSPICPTFWSWCFVLMLLLLLLLITGFIYCHLSQMNMLRASRYLVKNIF